MNELQEFSNGLIKLPVQVTENGDIQFNAEQAAIGLGLIQSKNKKIYVRWETVSKYLSQKVGKNDFITEPQFYKLAIKANNETAEKFQDWVTSEVLPTIRKHGAYMTPEKIEEALLNPDTIINLAKQLKSEREGRLIAEQQVNELQPKATYYDLILRNKTLLSITKIAKDYGLSGTAMNKKLHQLGVQFKQGKTWLLYQKYADKGYTQSQTFVDDTDTSRMSTYWTQAGRIFIYELLKQNGILPLIEQENIA
ncbi:phage antirepressor KilAC domain-containing protein [Loigolactobacillus backii]|uniref:phage antirepressor KilAC domain-containing protein n=1 Tax=Loigolactobacillus backii TaxID=375175 RepID=UPI0022FD415C|nr:phage antirepressor KilAC domain-containing protein [Loigolactobacillus backii]MDA5386491.1 phage antirepressor KilAC domain-containing protein [Loigolactobacillus backii]MDA5389018.1 phage antirepressor KilAC domain-containing protein [Loigolactobacillus backii]